MKLARSWMIFLLAAPGCEISGSVYLEKDWRTDERLYKNNDAISRIELKATQLVGKKS